MKSKVLFAAAALLAAAASAAQAAPVGQKQFLDNCAACHQATGKGIKGAFPALAGDPFVNGPPAKMLAVVLNGRAGMPSFKDDLDDNTIAAAVTYVRTSWGNKGGPVTAGLVKAARKGPPPPKNKPMQAH